MLEEGAADAHVLGGGKIYQPEAVVVCQLVDAEASNRWFICLLLSDLSGDDLHVMFWAAKIIYNYSIFERRLSGEVCFKC